MNSENQSTFPATNTTPQVQALQQAGGYQVNAYKSDPQECVSVADLCSALAEDMELASSDKDEVLMHVRACVGFGYWVEVFNASGELLAGPINPDLPLPAYIF